MTRTLNKVQLIGRLGADPQMKYMPSGTPVTTFSVATNRQWQDKEGNLREETDWHNIVAWEKLAQTCGEYLTKGRLVYIEGRLQTRSWESAGQTHYKTEIVASDMLMLDAKGAAAGEVEQAAQPVQEPVPARSGSRQSAAPAPVAASAGPARSSRPSRAVTVEAEEDPDDLPF